jgi:hypothetical protein
MTSENINLAILTEGDFLSEGNITLCISKIYFNKTLTIQMFQLY